MGSTQSKTEITPEEISSSDDEEIATDCNNVETSKTFMNKEGNLITHNNERDTNSCTVMTDEKDYLNSNVTDAVESNGFTSVLNKLTVERINDVTEEFNFLDQVSLVFLLYDQVDTALQELIVEKCNLECKKTKNLIANWAQITSKEANWREKFVEALAITQNFKVLKMLGFEKKIINEIFLPLDPYVSSYVSRCKKALYRVCESLTEEQIQSFLVYLKEDFGKEKLDYLSFNHIYLEVHLLQCFSLKYITENNLSKIINILKKLNLVLQIEYLDSFTGTEKSDEKKIPKTDNVNNKNYDFRINEELIQQSTKTKYNVESCSDNSVITDNNIISRIPKEELYLVDTENVGICLIINQYEFYKAEDPYLRMLTPSYQLKNRIGSEHDRNKIIETFKSFGFRIILKENLKHDEVKRVIQDAMNQFTAKDSCFVVFIMSHGLEKKIFGTNSVSVDISSIENTIQDINYKNLLGKPKILIIQSCQGVECQKVYDINAYNDTDGPVTNTNHNFNVPSLSGIPEKRDFLLFMSTVRGYASIRNEKQGSWFIQELCKIMDEEYDKKHLLDIMTKVIDVVSNMHWPKADGQVVTMVPEKKDTFSKKLYFKKIRNEPKNET